MNTLNWLRSNSINWASQLLLLKKFELIWVDWHTMINLWLAWLVEAFFYIFFHIKNSNYWKNSISFFHIACLSFICFLHVQMLVHAWTQFFSPSTLNTNWPGIFMFWKEQAKMVYGKRNFQTQNINLWTVIFLCVYIFKHAILFREFLSEIYFHFPPFFW